MGRAGILVPMASPQPHASAADRPLRTTAIKRHKKSFARAHPPRAELVFLLQSVDDPINVGALFRIADACAARELVLIGDTPAPPLPGISLTARGCERRVPWRYVRRVEDAIAELRAGGYGIVALELTGAAVLFTDYDYPEKVCLVLGSEGRGVWPKTLRLSDATVFIPMYGDGPSLNVHVAAALVAYQVMVGGPPG